MRNETPLLRTQLLTWLLAPLFLLLTADSFISYWVAVSFSQRAYDRTLVEVAREVSLYLRRANGGGHGRRKVFLMNVTEAQHELCGERQQRERGAEVSGFTCPPGHGRNVILLHSLVKLMPLGMGRWDRFSARL